ncbi:hypothetical protein ACHHRT_10415 [Desulfurivibrio sp. D14AmB]|uniref:hypothetical protein n=1 Tax=Desulfurivibrio sp. D14AmB TaxID=3374370 RepID=UPI00376EE642
MTTQAVHAAMMIHHMNIVGDGDQSDTTDVATARNPGRRMGEAAAPRQKLMICWADLFGSTLVFNLRKVARYGPGVV